MFANFGECELESLLPIVAGIRAAGVSVEIYPEAAKMKKQFGYADDKHIPYVAIIGENEMAASKINLKNMTTGEQQLLTIEQLLSIVGGD